MSTKTGDCLITYDIDKNYGIIKEAMKKLGYLDKVQIGQQVCDLPNTTLWKSQTSTDTALIDLKRICIQTSTKLEKAIAVLGTDWVGV